MLKAAPRLICVGRTCSADGRPRPAPATHHTNTPNDPTTMPMPRDLPPADDGDDDDDHQPQQHAATAGAAADSSIVALCENRRFEIGMACFRTSDFSVELSAFCDDQAYSKCLSVLARHEPRARFPTARRSRCSSGLCWPSTRTRRSPICRGGRGTRPRVRANAPAPQGGVGGPVLVGRISVGA